MFLKNTSSLHFIYFSRYVLLVHSNKVYLLFTEIVIETTFEKDAKRKKELQSIKKKYHLQVKIKKLYLGDIIIAILFAE